MSNDQYPHAEVFNFKVVIHAVFGPFAADTRRLYTTKRRGFIGDNALVNAHNAIFKPAGMPARWASSARARAKADKGVLVAGLHTTVQPAARAGAIFRVSIALGKFQGVMQATTPTGCLMQTMRLSLEGWGMVSP